MVKKKLTRPGCRRKSVHELCLEILDTLNKKFTPDEERVIAQLTRKLKRNSDNLQNALNSAQKQKPKPNNGGK